MVRYRTSIIIDNSTRDELKKIGRKEQTYDDIITELISFGRKLKENRIDPLSPTYQATLSGSGGI